MHVPVNPVWAGHDNSSKLLLLVLQSAALEEPLLKYGFNAVQMLTR